MRFNFIVAMVLTLSMILNVAFAYELEGENYRFGSPIYVLEQLGIVDDSNDINFEANITRRECLKYLLKVLIYEVPKADSVNLQKNIFCDLSPNTDDYAIAYMANNFQIFNGKIDENGDIYAALDDKLTLKESVFLLCRMLYSSKTMCNFIESDLEIWYEYAMNMGILENELKWYDTYETRSISGIDRENDLVNTAEWLYLLYRTMHVIIPHDGYGGTFMSSIMDDYIMNMD